MISRLEIKSLFGLYNYDISFDGGVKIITGPNGYGKTTILTIINNLYSKNFWYFYYLDFDIIEIVVDDRIITIKKILKNSETLKEECEVEFLLDNASIFKLNDSYIKRLEPFRNYGYRHRSNDFYERYAVKSDDELLALFYNADEDDYVKSKGNELSMFFSDNRSVNFIDANRILRKKTSISSERRIEYTIDVISTELGKEYERQQNKFAEESRKIDAGFIKRLVTEETPVLSDVQLKDSIEALRQTIKDYQKFNIVAKDFDIEDFDFSEKYKDAIALYMSDMKKKMDIFKPFYDKLNLFQKFILEKELSDKRVDFSENGIKIKNIKGRVLDNLHKLSSGEQNLLILYYNLIFKSNKNTVMLVDEPENSLHMAWLGNMLDDYKEIARSVGCQIIIATHSPSFINGEWDLTTDLYELNK